ncbi:caspase family protein [Brevibacillus migulae]|uniref:caspase family protein n=1 Tax=Brevibacillus migulae TaxID=1644114 RepID=UPI00106DF728|nr:caspase family protein [Brevibacillus migulae]
MRKALIVGLNDYPTAPLYGCVNDALSIATVLGKNGDGSPNFSVKTITNSVNKATLRESIEKLFDGDNDITLFYFSGHGLIKSTGGYIVTTDYSRYDEGISMDEILNLANRSKARDKVIILDCCHSGAFGSPALSEGKLAQLCDGLTVLTASKSSESAIEVNGSGIFTSLLIDALQGGAADLRGNITSSSVYSYIDEALGAWEQRPIFKTNVSRFTPLRRVEPRIPLVTLRKIHEYFVSPEEEYQLDPSYEFTEPSADEEKVEIFKNLQKFVSVGLVVPVGEEHMYFAAINSKTCRLTALGYQYWRLAEEGKL